MKNKNIKKQMITIGYKMFIVICFIASVICLFQHGRQYKKQNDVIINVINEEQNITKENIDISQNVPISEDLKNKMEEEQKQKEEEEQKRIEQQKIEEEKKKQEQIKAAQKEQTTVTSRGGTTSIKREETTTKNNGEWIAFNASAYCPCAKCCGKTNGITASGTKATAGRTVAMPKGYAFGTKIEIKGMGTYVVEDRGGAIKGNKIDIYFDTHQQALNFGRKTVYLKVVK